MNENEIMEVKAEEIEATNELDNTNYEVAAEPENTGLSTGDKVLIGGILVNAAIGAAWVTKKVFIGSKDEDALVKKGFKKVKGFFAKKDKEPEVIEGEVVTEEK